PLGTRAAGLWSRCAPGRPAPRRFPDLKGTTMFRNDLGNVSLFGGRTAAGPRPSLRPAVEALEERVVLDSSMGESLAPSDHSPSDNSNPAAVAVIAQISALTEVFNTKLQQALARAERTGDFSRADKLANQINTFFDKTAPALISFMIGEGHTG